jgi:hypothetical protein
MARYNNGNRTYAIIGVLAALLIILFLWTQGYLGGRGGDNVLAPPTAAPNP